MQSKGQGTFGKSSTKKVHAQGAIEYLLIIAAAILVVAITILAVTGALGGGQDQTDTGEDQVFDAFHDLRVKGIGYKIEIVASNNSYGWSATTDAFAPHCTFREGALCSWPILDASSIFGSNYDSCLDTGSTITIELTDLETSDKTTEILDVTEINFRASPPETKTFIINYHGDPNHNHNIRAYFTDCCQGKREDGSFECNPEPELGKEDPEYKFDKNMKVLSITIKNSEGADVGSQTKTSCQSSSPTAPCYDLNFI